MNQTIGLIGAGNMGGALYRNLVISGFKVVVYDRSYPKARALAKNNAVKNLASLLKQSGCLIIAVKPQSFPELASELNGQAGSKLIISIMTGINTKKIAVLLKTKKITRVVPNLPAQVGTGFSGWFASDTVTAGEKKFIKNILSSFGAEAEIKREIDLNSITALSGSGPAYFFYLTELLEEAARGFGFNEALSRQIAESTFWGAATLLKTHPRRAKDWRLAVTSKKGTTEAALKHLQSKKFNKIFLTAIKQAKKRAVELSR